MAVVRTVASVALCALLVAVSLASKAQEFEKQRVDPNRAGKADFDYDGLAGKGPDKWSDISPDFDICNKGHHQSPINLNVKAASSDGIMPTVNMSESVVSYAPSGRNFVLNCEGRAGSKYCSTITYYSERYHMLQAHFHSPSEHHIDGKEFPLELHLVHKSEKGDALLVLGILFEIGKSPSDDIQGLLDIAKKQGTGVVDFPHFVQPGAGLCTYEGSLTTPPCTEGVHWLLSTVHPHVNLRQVGEYREMLGEQLNNRPVQTVPDPQAKCYLDPDFVGGVAKLPGKHTSSNTKTTNVASSSSSSSASSSASGHSSSGHSSSADHSSSGHSSSGDKTTSATATDGNPSTPTDKSQTTTETASGDQQGLVTPATASDPSSSCFPSDALVTVEGSGEVPISTVQIGDRVLVGAGTFSPVFAFSHRDPSVMTEHAEFTLSSGRKLTLTPGHHLEANGKLVAAGEVRVGDVLIAANGASDSVSQIKSVRATGLYNPHTLSGSIAVNGVVCSTYTTAVASSAAQALLAPLRALFLTGAVTERTAGQFLARGASSRLF